MTDDQWKAEIYKIEDPRELLYELVKLDNEVSGVGDPYYRDLYQTIIDKARALNIDDF